VQRASRRDLGRSFRHPLRIDGASRGDEPARRSAGPRPRARDRHRPGIGVASGRVKLGIVTPGLTLLPRVHAQWEETAGFADIVAIAREAERLGYHPCTCSEHLSVPVYVAAVRGGRYYEPLATFCFLGVPTKSN